MSRATPAVVRTNPLAIISLVLGLLLWFGIPAIVLGHLSLGQITRTGERGNKLAIAGLALGYGEVLSGFFVVLGIVLTVVSNPSMFG
jgi:hypothetical protein